MQGGYPVERAVGRWQSRGLRCTRIHYMRHGGFSKGSPRGLQEDHIENSHVSSQRSICDAWNE